MNRFGLATERHGGMIVEEMLKAVAKNPQDRLWQQPPQRKRHAVGPNRLRQFARYQAVSARAFAFQSEAGGHAFEHRKTGLGIGLQSAGLELELYFGNVTPPPRRVDDAFIDVNPHDAAIVGMRIRHAPNVGAKL